MAIHKSRNHMAINLNLYTIPKFITLIPLPPSNPLLSFSLDSPSPLPLPPILTFLRVSCFIYFLFPISIGQTTKTFLSSLFYDNNKIFIHSNKFSFFHFITL
ncbi:unnamed protein product [Meloidogyne enterolobii]|uniref:Uncharacterized protein n=1 Tax=Meloidogyne enterolobii TaxID=390850 RepID=A0ACB1A4N4_MELEN